MREGGEFILKLATASANAQVVRLHNSVDIESYAEAPAESLAMNGIGLATLTLDRPLAVLDYASSRELGGFILIDRLSNATVGAGMIRFPLRRAANLAWQDFTVDKTTRVAIKGHRPAVLWFTGLSGAGKSTIAQELVARCTTTSSAAAESAGRNRQDSSTGSPAGSKYASGGGRGIDS